MDRQYTEKDLTVVIPAHNCADYLADAIASIEAQTRQPAQVIVVENASTDATRRVLEALQASSSLNLKVLYTDCPGVSNARNLGFSLASTRLVAMLDADDLYRPEFLQMGLEAYNRVAGLVLFFGNRQSLRGDLVGGQSFLERTRLTEVDFRQVAPGLRQVTGDIFRPLLYGNFISPSTAIVCRHAAYRAGLFPNFLDSSEDRLFFARLVRQGPVAYSMQPLSLYRIHDMSKTASENLLYLRKNAVLCLRYLALELSGEILGRSEKLALKASVQDAAEKLFYTAAERGPGEYARTRTWAKTVGVQNPRPVWFQLKALRNLNFRFALLRRSP